MFFLNILNATLWNDHDQIDKSVRVLLIGTILYILLYMASYGTLNKYLLYVIIADIVIVSIFFHFQIKNSMNSDDVVVMPIKEDVNVIDDNELLKKDIIETMKSISKSSQIVVDDKDVDNEIPIYDADKDI